jgi:phage gp36-like protein
VLNKNTFIAVFFLYVSQIVNDFRKKVQNLLKTFIQKMLECIISLQISNDSSTITGQGDEFDNQEVKQYAKYTLVVYIV